MTSLDAVYAATSAYRDCPRDEIQARALALRQALSALLDIDEPDIYVTKLTNKGYQNQVWQGEGNTQSKKLFVFVDKGASEAGLPDCLRLRLCPDRPNGFEAILVAGGDNSGFKIKTVVQYGTSAVGDRLRTALGDKVNVRVVPDPHQEHQLRASPTEPSSYPTPESILLHLREATNVILQGPPGTGKTFLAMEVIAKAAGEAESRSCRLETILGDREVHELTVEELAELPLVWDVAQLHPGYTYEDFVRGLRTDPEARPFGFISQDGLLTRMASVAEKARCPVILLLDEINRCDMPSVLGETIFAIDPGHRGEAVRLQYEATNTASDGLAVPSNLLILGTMNTADRSVAMLDFAIRRRFRFIEVPPAVEALGAFYESHPKRAALTTSILSALAPMVASQDLQPGHAYLMVDGAGSLDNKTWGSRILRKMLYEVRPLLQEYGAEGLLTHIRSLELGETRVPFPGDDRQSAQTALKDWMSAMLEVELD